MAKRLVLKNKELRTRILSLFDELDRNERKMRAFVSNPTGMLAGKVFKGSLPRQQQSESNRLLFSILANDKFRNWMDRYTAANKKKRVTDNQFAQDFAKAVIELGDDNILLAVLKSQGQTIRLPGMGDRFQQLIINNPAKSAAATSVCTPSSCDKKASGFGFGAVINPAIMRSVLDHLIAHGKDLSQKGKLSDASAKFS